VSVKVEPLDDDRYPQICWTAPRTTLRPDGEIGSINSTRREKGACSSLGRIGNGSLIGFSNVGLTWEEYS
jgi:hypothetical protein